MTATDTSPDTTVDTSNYVVISADTHAGGSHAAYREYLDPRYRDDFDAWRGGYRNPYRDLGDQRRLRNWDNEMRNNAQWVEEGVVGEVVFPNTVPPFFPSFVLFAQPPKPDEYEHRRAGIHAHNRWLKDFCAEFPDRRAGVGQIFLNDVDDAIEDVKWIAENGLRGGILLPNIAPDVKWVKPLHDPCYDPLWEVIQDLEVPVNMHSGTGNPDYGKYPISMLLYINEVGWYTQRPLVHLILGAVFERFPGLDFVLTEIGSSWIPPLLEQLDGTIERIRSTGETGEIKYDRGVLPSMLASEMWAQCGWVGVSGPGQADIDGRYDIGIDRFMWGSDYPHDEGTHPHTKDHLRRRFAALGDEECRKMLAGNAARLYDFDLDKLAPLAERYGPTYEELHTPPDGPDPRVEKLIGDDMDTDAL
ncbi:MAG: amidohydrolase [Actinobacteria bacterium]|nr:amidohydrolase [Actinomycetota bacterium]NIS29903.1 amidohydrolase [Actinomycetota bacterium]NIT94758.1 amidohydrolase [Actinomycetota bacterium]NIU18415.1 amidohydrolase [Actinomycetota bacterium]NIU65183.1 amidohydrolase [Actinomycetota bacterium]